MTQGYQIEQLWRQYKYEVLWHNQNSYNNIRETMKQSPSYEDIALLISDALTIKPTKGSIINTYDHMWGYFKKMCSSSENEFQKDIKYQFQQHKIDETYLLEFLKSMADFYNVDYIKQSSIIKSLK
ncbi:YbgA family protein [Staphylococcus equorum]|uniref:YbgA family protein n=1 Tax=Staphylococcus equorum TaxID=246432 RepID=A0A9X4LE37_9STAP|nr:DUF1722 domain-containing protein [Staphylococcus equorum]MDG0843078.1 YbgA family protein [Staphylococcus equorum]MDG0858970.1 YbgA family protein [Staphylococcus equorum]